MDIKIGLAAHKEYRVPESDIYLPLQVGAAGKESILAVRVVKNDGVSSVDATEMTRDDSGDHISAMNPRYCELTGLYWLWKNCRAEYYGLVHYRRYFKNFTKKKKDPFLNVLDRGHLEELLRKTDIILPKKRNYYIESIYSHYAHSHYANHLDETRQILKERCSEYVPAFDEVMRGKKAHMFNMAIMKKSKFDAYCEWMFPIVMELDQRIDSTAYDPFQARFPGRVSELLMDVWIKTNGFSYREVPVIMMGKVQWGRKIFSFLRAKFFGKKYRKGF